MATSFKNRYTADLQLLSVLMVLFVTLGYTGCGDTGPTNNQQPVIHFPLTMALSDSLGDEGNPLPDDIKSMLRPLEVKNCPNFIFIPDVTIVRVDVPDAKPEVLNLGIDQNGIEKAMGKPLLPEKARSVRNDAVAIVKISSLMAQPKGESGVAILNLKKLLASASNQNIFTTEGTKRELGEASNSSKTVVATDLNDLVAKMGLSFCGKPNSKPTANASLIFYKAGDSGPASSSSPSTSPGNSANSSQSPNPTLSREDADLLFGQLSPQVQSALQGKGNRKEIDNRLVEANERFPQDFRFYYERAKLLASIGKNQHPAFTLLFATAQIAITNGESKKMLKQMEGDSVEGAVFHNLHHHDEWETMERALSNNNAEMVRQ